jgi:hypothetical protein
MVHQIRDPQVNRHTANFRRLLRLLPIGENPIQEIGGTELEPRPPPLLDQRTHPIGRQGIRIRMLHHNTTIAIAISKNMMKVQGPPTYLCHPQMHSTQKRI